MKLKLSIFTVILGICLSFAQESSQVDLVIMVDDQIVVAPQSLKLISQKDGLNISPNYHPGNLSMPKSKYADLISKDYESLNLVFSYTKECKGKTKDYFYEIPFSTKWLKESFIVLNIYNFDNRKFKKK